MSSSCTRVVAAATSVYKVSSVNVRQPTHMHAIMCMRAGCQQVDQQVLCSWLSAFTATEACMFVWVAAEHSTKQCVCLPWPKLRHGQQRTVARVLRVRRLLVFHVHTNTPTLSAYMPQHRYPALLLKPTHYWLSPMGYAVGGCKVVVVVWCAR